MYEGVRARYGARDLDLASAAGEFEGVREQIDDDLTKLVLVGPHRDARRTVGKGECDSARQCLRRNQRLRRGECFPQANIHDVEAHRTGLELRVVEHLVDEPQEVPLARLDASQVVPLQVRDRTAKTHREQLDIPPDCVEWRAQLVAHHGEELAFRLICRLRLPPRSFGIGARAFSLGELSLGVGEESLHLLSRQHLFGDIRPMGHHARASSIRFDERLHDIVEVPRFEGRADNALDQRGHSTPNPRLATLSHMVE